MSVDPQDGPCRGVERLRLAILLRVHANTGHPWRLSPKCGQTLSAGMSWDGELCGVKILCRGLMKGQFMGEEVLLWIEGLGFDDICESSCISSSEFTGNATGFRL